MSKMTMSYELITPEVAESMLEKNATNNRRISRGTVEVYARDMVNGDWDEDVGASISFDENGILRDGQHRLCAIVKSGVAINTWVCRNVSADGIYDNNRKRSLRDQVLIMDDSLESIYYSSRYHAVAKAIIARFDRRKIGAKEVVAFTKKHKEELDGFFLNIPHSTPPKVSVATVHLALFLAYHAGIGMNVINDFYEVLYSGMSTKPEDFPIIAYRNYLKDNDTRYTTIPEVARCQYALKKYISGSCTKRSVAQKALIWDLPWQEDG